MILAIGSNCWRKMLVLIILLLTFSQNLLASPEFYNSLSDRHFKWIEQMQMQLNNQHKVSPKKEITLKSKKTKTKKKIDLKIEIGLIQVEEFNHIDSCLKLSELERNAIERSVNNYQWDLDSYPTYDSVQGACRDQFLANLPIEVSSEQEETRKKLLASSIIDRWIMKSLQKSLLPDEYMPKTKLHAQVTNQGFEVIGYVPVLSGNSKIDEEQTKVSSGVILILGKFKEKNLGLIGETGSLSIKSDEVKIQLKGFLGALAHSNMVEQDSIKIATSSFYQEEKDLKLGGSAKVSIARVLGFLSGNFVGKLSETIDFAAKGELHVGVLSGSNLLSNAELGVQSRNDKDALTFIKLRIIRGYLSETEKDPRKGTNFLRRSDVQLGQLRSMVSEDGSAKFQIGLTLIQPTNASERSALGQLKLELNANSFFSFNISGKGAITKKTIDDSDMAFWAKAKVDTRINLSDSGFYLTAYYFIQSNITPIQYGEGNILDMDLLPVEVDGPFYQYGIMLEYVFE